MGFPPITGVGLLGGGKPLLGEWAHHRHGHYDLSAVPVNRVVLEEDTPWDS